MRKLNTSDVFSALRVIKAANIREEIKPVLKRAAAGELSIEDVGIDGILSVVEMLAEKRSERAIYEFLASPFEMTADDVSQLDIMELAERVQELGKENDLKRFFTYVSGILTKK